MAQVVRIPKRVYRMHWLRSHVEQYRTVIPSEDIVYDAGNPMSPLVIVKAHPEPEEMRMGEPFHGRRSNLLYKLLDSIGLHYRDVWITHVYKYGPMEALTPAQRSAARVFMDWELQELDPRIVVTVGPIVTQLLMGPDAHLGLLRGKLHERRLHSLQEDKRVTVFPVFDLDGGLRSSSIRTTLYDDFQLLKAYL